MKGCTTGNIFLIGLMGAGKTTIGRQLAKAQNKTFLDSDHEIEQRTGVNIPLIFELEGESGFRGREKAIIEELTLGRDTILATGGGAVLNEQNRANLSSRGTVVYLRAAIADLLARTKHDKNRPLLQTADPQKKLEELFSQRDPLYREIADIIIETGQQSVPQLVRQLEKKLQELNPTHANADR